MKIFKKKKLPQKKIKIPLNIVFNYVYFIIVFIAFISFAFVSWFLYNNFYKTITQSEKVVFLRKQVAMEDINMKKFDLVIQRIKNKIKKRKSKAKLNF